MTERELEKKLQGAVEHAAPRDVSGVLARCGGRTEQTAGKGSPGRGRRLLPWLAAACLVLVLAGGGALHLLWQEQVVSVVSLDVNPSVELQVNRDSRIVEARALNEDARAILKDMDLKGTEVNVAVNAVVGSLLRHGYLEDLSSAILISVEDPDAQRAQQLEESLRREVGAALESNAANAAVLARTVVDEGGLKEQAARSGISLGKAALVKEVQALNGELQFEALAGLTVGELKALADTGAPGTPVGKAGAAAAALAFAGLREDGTVVVEVEPELDDSCPHYDVELKTLSGEFEYEIAAYTGQVLKGQKNVKVTVPAGAITPEEAEKTAQSHAGVQADSTEVTPEFENGRPLFKVELRRGDMEYEYEIDAATGTILKHEAENDPEDADDDADDDDADDDGDDDDDDRDDD